MNKTAILLATYCPNMEWLKKQLCSVNSQTYKNLVLYVRDDCSPPEVYEKIKSLIAECITDFPYFVMQNEKNLGSTETFEKLTAQAQGDFFAYCDQDDIWMPEKIERFIDEITSNNVLLVCSDVKIIDEKDTVTAGSIKDIRRGFTFRSGIGLTRGLLTKNFVIGCASLVKADAAKAAIPFCPYVCHDHYLALCCSMHGKIISLSDATVMYRQHGENQTGLVKGIYDKQSYYRMRIETGIHKYSWMKDNFSCSPEIKQLIERYLKWTQQRKKHWITGKNAKELWKYRDCNPKITLFEIVAVYFPEKLFGFLISLKQKNIL